MRRVVPLTALIALLLGSVIAPPASADIGPPAEPVVWRPGAFYLRDAQTSGVADHLIVYGDPSQHEVPLLCDFSGTGIKTPAVVRGNQWFVRFEAGDGPADASFTFGDPGDIPACGDWDGAGTGAGQNGNAQTPAVFRIGYTQPDGTYNPYAGTFYYRYSLTSGVADASFYWPDLRDDAFVPLDASKLQVLTGKWEGTNPQIDLPAIYQDGVFSFATPRCVNGHVCNNTYHLFLGDGADLAVAGDWDANGEGDIGVVRNGTWFLRYLVHPAPSTALGAADVTFDYGNAGDVPLSR
jgi:hypothetical protein